VMKPGSGKNHGCEHCRNRSGAHLELLSEERNEYFSGKAWEVVSKYQCKACGARWNDIVGGGVGGPESFWSPA